MWWQACIDSKHTVIPSVETRVNGLEEECLSYKEDIVTAVVKKKTLHQHAYITHHFHTERDREKQVRQSVKKRGHEPISAVTSLSIFIKVKHEVNSKPNRRGRKQMRGEGTNKQTNKQTNKKGKEE
jgi:hypothetical protein